MYCGRGGALYEIRGFFCHKVRVVGRDLRHLEVEKLKWVRTAEEELKVSEGETLREEQ